MFSSSTKPQTVILHKIDKKVHNEANETRNLALVTALEKGQINEKKIQQLGLDFALYAKKKNVGNLFCNFYQGCMKKNSFMKD